MDRKLDGLCPFWGEMGWVMPRFGGDRSPSNTNSPEPRPTSLQSGIVIHPAVWPQRTWGEIGEAVPLLGET